MNDAITVLQSLLTEITELRMKYVNEAMMLPIESYSYGVWEGHAAAYRHVSDLIMKEIDCLEDVQRTSAAVITDRPF